MAQIILSSRRMTMPPKRGRLTKDRAAFCKLVSDGVRPVDAFRKVWQEKSRKLQLSGSYEVLKAANALLRNEAVHRRVAELLDARMRAMTEARYGRQVV